MVAVLEVNSRVIGGGIWDGEDVIIMINDNTKELDMIYLGEHK